MHRTAPRKTKQESKQTVGKKGRWKMLLPISLECSSETYKEIVSHLFADKKRTRLFIFIR
jgi:hypothetical protein